MIYYAGESNDEFDPIDSNEEDGSETNYNDDDPYSYMGIICLYLSINFLIFIVH